MPKKKKKGIPNLDSTLQKYNINESRIKVFNEKEDRFRKSTSMLRVKSRA